MNSNIVVWHKKRVSREYRDRFHGHKSLSLWFTGLPGAAKSILANALESRLHTNACATVVLDGDNVQLVYVGISVFHRKIELKIFVA